MAPETMSTSDKGSYLLVEFFGEFSVEAGKQCVDRMVEACKEHSKSKVLLDCRKMTGAMPILDRYLVADYGASKGRLLMQLALLNREGVPLPDNFVENVAVNRGMNMKVFTDHDEALYWLTGVAPNSSDSGNGK